jgi:hypothetical protein
LANGAAFGYADEHPSLKKLLFALLVTDYAHQLNGDIPQAVRGFVLPRAGASEEEYVHHYKALS